MAPLIVWLSFLGAVTAQSCQVHSDTFEADFCQMKAAVDVLKGDTQRVSNNEVELSKLWHTIHAETKSIYDNRKMIDVIKRNLTDLSIAPNTSPDVMEKLHNITSTLDDKMKNLTDTVTALEFRMRQLEIKCSSCGTRGHPCDLQPCENGGKCVELGKDFYCACPIGFAGKLCDVTDHCVPSPCLNNGTCVNNVVSHTCLCPLPYTGPNCTIELTVCDTNPCARGMCVPDGRNFKCLCDPGFYGDLCNSVVDLSLITTASSTLPSKSTNSTLPPKSTTSTLPSKSTLSTISSTPLSAKNTTQSPTASTTQNSTKLSSQAPTSPSSLTPGTNITTATDPCATPSEFVELLNIKKAAPKLVDEGPVPSKRKARDRKRLCKYLENKRIMRELPFSSLRDNHFRSICDTSCTLRAELKNVKIQLCVSNKENKNMVIKLSKAQCEIEKLENQNMVMKKKMQEQSNNSNDNIFREKIRKLKEDAQADKVLMDLMQRKLNNIGKDYSQYVVKIQEEAEQTAKQLREENNALLQTIRLFKDEREHLLAEFVENKQYHPRRYQGRQRRGRFY
ncbi:uncharacterized protein LOC134267175 [Saccostrea cucullata]|uniref:uncharacterized protein LOC134267175 n=1 Tax=Saccostrea cuccullata TaxID=36930 RepID=UPI002ED55038